MTSPLLALFARSVRADTRGKATYAARAGLAVFILLVMLMIAATTRSGGAPGLIFFGSVISLQAVSITLVGLSYFASAITEEKEEETLGLLRMTNLNPLSILLGKSTSRLCGALLLLAAQLPFTLLAITLGGVSLAQILASYCTLGAYTFFLCNLALLWSVIAPNTARAALGAIATLVVFFTAGLLLESLHAALLDHGWLAGGSAMEGKMEAIAAAVAAGTPVARLMQILRTGFSGAPAGWQVWSNLALGIACFLAAWAGFARFADRALDAAPARGRISGLRFRRPPRPWKNALAWKDFHFLGGGKPGFVLRVLVYGGAAAWMVAGTIGADGNSAVVVGSISSSLISFAFLLELAVVASRIFRSELRDQTWPDLVLLPLTVRQVAWRKLSGLLLALVPAGVAAILASGLTVLTAGRISGVAWSGGFSPAVILASALSSGITALFIAHLVAFLSLLMKRGALALGFVIAYAVSTAIQIFAMTLIFAGAGFGSASASALATRMMIGPLVTSAIHLVAVFFLHRAILLRLEALAAEG